MFKLLWTTWIALSVIGAGWLLTALPNSENPSAASMVFLPGKTTHGHHQIEMNCTACHLPDGGVTDASCVSCHGSDLKRKRDTHPKSKFIDPTKASLLDRIDAQNCITCHVEHQEEHTRPMGLTVPLDFCVHCHRDIADDRPSHQGMSFSSCTQAGCHNYHDNTALYENFLRKHLDEPDHLVDGRNPLRRLEQWLAVGNRISGPDRLTFEAADAPLEWQTGESLRQWSASAHAGRGINCSGCHRVPHGDLSAEVNSADIPWVEQPNHDSCRQCHRAEVEGFLQGKHGMRRGSGLAAMTPGEAVLPMHAASSHRELNCSACHSAHNPDPSFAAYKACIGCHNDEHTQSYSESSHFDLWQQEISGDAPAGSGVSCATCHMPRNSDGIVEHNQNANLQPNEQMARTTCLQCHGLQFTLDSLADERLLKNCYSSRPERHVQSLEMVREWFDSKNRKGPTGKADASSDD